VLVEGGAAVAAQLLAAELVDRLVIFIAPAVMGGDGVPALGPLGIARAADAIRLERTTVRRAGDDVVVEGAPRWRRRRPLPLAGSRATLKR
jgi:diaminohydroxyphosphoribosylaminopyrimidine deaminase/5-amino-6-(5-phosphoribosylamino)uracil reductase